MLIGNYIMRWIVGKVRIYEVTEVELRLIIDKLDKLSQRCYNSSNSDLIDVSFEIDDILDSLEDIHEYNKVSHV